MSAFDKLHPNIKEAIGNLGWDKLRPLQVDAIQAIMDTGDDVILYAPTASGKTEAAFLPVLSHVVADPSDSVAVLCVSPLKALINDQAPRLEAMCAYAGIPVHRWHGDVSDSAKKRLRKNPAGVLLITPESLESQLVNHGGKLHRLYRDLRFVVIDELHAFLGNVRGRHLLSVLARIEAAAEVRPRRIGLSATIGDFAPARRFLRREAPQRVRIVEDPSQRKELRVVVKAYVEEEEATDEPMGLSAVVLDVAAKFRDAVNLLFCNSRKQTELVADKLASMAKEQGWTRNPFLLHHGSLSRHLREQTERDLKAGQPVTAICTSTLELGIDIGAVRAVGQVGPPSTVASLVQRLGRSGRGEGEFQLLRLYTIDSPVIPQSPLTDKLYPKLIQAIALVELIREQWLEPPEDDLFHFSTATHQILSVLRQTGGCAAPQLHEVLCRRGAFSKIQPAQFHELLTGLTATELIEPADRHERRDNQAGDQTGVWIGRRREKRVKTRG